MHTWFVLANLLGAYGDSQRSNQSSINTAIKNSYRNTLLSYEFNYAQVESKHFSMILWSVGTIFKRMTSENSADQQIRNFALRFTRSTIDQISRDAPRMHQAQRLNQFFKRDPHISNAIKGLSILNINIKREFPTFYNVVIHRNWDKDSGIAAINVFVALGDDRILVKGEDQSELNTLWENITKLNLWYKDLNSSHILKLLVKLTSSKKNKYEIPDILLERLVKSNASETTFKYPFVSQKILTTNLVYPLLLLKSLALFTTNNNNPALLHNVLKKIYELLHYRSASWENLLFLDNICTGLTEKKAHIQRYLMDFTNHILIPKVRQKINSREPISDSLKPEIHRLLQKYRIRSNVKLEINYDSLSLNALGNELRKMLNEDEDSRDVPTTLFLKKLNNEPHFSAGTWGVFSSVYIAVFNQPPSRRELTFRIYFNHFLKNKTCQENGCSISDSDLASICQYLIAKNVIQNIKFPDYGPSEQSNEALNRELNTQLADLIAPRLQAPQYMTGTTYSLLFKSYAYLTENYMQKRFPIIDVNTRLIEEKYGNAQLSSMDVVALLQGVAKTRSKPPTDFTVFVFNYLQSCLATDSQIKITSYELAEIVSSLANLAVIIPENILQDIKQCSHLTHIKDADYIKLMRALCIFHTVHLPELSQDQNNAVWNLISTFIGRLNPSHSGSSSSSSGSAECDHIEIVGKKIFLQGHSERSNPSLVRQDFSHLTQPDRSMLMTVKEYLKAQNQTRLANEIPDLDATQDITNTVTHDKIITYLKSEIPKLKSHYSLTSIEVEPEGKIDYLSTPFDIKLAITTEHDQQLTIFIEINGNQHYMIDKFINGPRRLSNRLCPKYLLKQRIAEAYGAYVIQISNRNTNTREHMNTISDQIREALTTI